MSFLDDLTSTDFALLLDIVSSNPQSSDADGAESAPEAARQPSQPGRGPSNAYRRRKREELDRLRQEVETLQKRVESSGACATTQPMLPASSSVWSRMAAQQRKARKHSELDNARLKKEVERQHTLTLQLQSILQKQANQQHIKRTRHGISSARVGFDSSVILRDWTSDVTARARVDALFAEAAFQDVTRDFEDISFHTRSPPYIQVRQARVFPFDMATVQHSTWGLRTAVPCLTLVCETKVWTDELFVVQYETPTSVGRVDVTLHGKLTVRRLQEPTRSVNVFTLVYTVRSDHSAYDGIQMLGEGFYSIASAVGQDDTTHSIVHCLERTTVRGVQRHDLKLLSGLVSDQYSAHFDRVENALMDGLIQRQPSL